MGKLSQIPAHFQREHGDLLWTVDVVPDTQVVVVLSHHHVAAWNPLHVVAEAQDGGFHSALNVKQVQLNRHRTSGHKQSHEVSANSYHFINLFTLLHCVVPVTSCPGRAACVRSHLAPASRSPSHD